MALLASVAAAAAAVTARSTRTSAPSVSAQPSAFASASDHAARAACSVHARADVEWVDVCICAFCCGHSCEQGRVHAARGGGVIELVFGRSLRVLCMGRGV